MKRKKSISFPDWITQTGVTSLAKDLDVDPRTIRNWRAGIYLPKAHQLYTLVKLSKGALTFEAVLASRKRSAR